MASDGASIVLLHGVGLDRRMWDPLVADLNSAGFTCAALDLPGHGDRPPLRSKQTLESLAEDVRRRLPSGPIHLVGFSLGALIAQHLARFHPESILTLTCVSSVCLRTDEEARQVEARLATAGTHFHAGVDAAIERWYPADTSTVPSEVVEETRTTLLANDLTSYLHAYEVFARGDREIGPELPGITLPVLAITGELDPGSTPEMSSRLAQAVPNGRVIIAPGIRHMLPLENTKLLTTALLEHIHDAEGT